MCCSTFARKGPEWANETTRPGQSRSASKPETNWYVYQLGWPWTAESVAAASAASAENVPTQTVYSPD